MKCIIEFEDKPCCDNPNLYRMKHTNTVYVSRETLEKFPRCEEPSKNDDRRLEDLENLKEGDVVFAKSDKGVIRMGLVIFVYSGEEDPYEIVSNCGVVMRRSVKDLFELGYQKSFAVWTTEEFFSKSKQHADEVRDEASEELSNLQPGDVIYRNLKGGELQRRIVNYVFPRPGCYEFINESGWKVRCNLPNLIDEGWHKLKYELTTKEFYRKLREEECDDK